MTARTPAAAPQLPHDLHRHERLARAGRERQQQPLIAPENRRHQAIDRSALVVARLLDRAVEVAQAPIERQRDAVRGEWRVKALEGTVAHPQLLRPPEGVEALSLAAGVAVILDDSPAVRRVREHVIPTRVLLQWTAWHGRSVSTRVTNAMAHRAPLAAVKAIVYRGQLSALSRSGSAVGWIPPSRRKQVSPASSRCPDSEGSADEVTP